MNEQIKQALLTERGIMARLQATRFTARIYRAVAIIEAYPAATQWLAVQLSRALLEFDEKMDEIWDQHVHDEYDLKVDQDTQTLEVDVDAISDMLDKVKDAMIDDDEFRRRLESLGIE